MARPSKGLGHIDGLDGDEESKYRAKVVLATMTGEMLVDEAYEELGVGPTQFAHMRKEVLQGAVDAMRPKPVGRRKRVSEKTDEEIAEMERYIKDLERDLKVLRARVEVAVLPLLQRMPTRRGRAESAGEAPPP